MPDGKQETLPASDHRPGARCLLCRVFDHGVSLKAVIMSVGATLFQVDYATV